VLRRGWVRQRGQDSDPVEGWPVNPHRAGALRAQRGRAATRESVCDA